MMFGSLSETAMSSMRPPMLAGPIERNRKLERTGLPTGLMTGLMTGLADGANGPCEPAIAARSGTAINGAARRRIRRNRVCMDGVLRKNALRKRSRRAVSHRTRSMSRFTSEQMSHNHARVADGRPFAGGTGDRQVAPGVGELHFVLVGGRTVMT